MKVLSAILFLVYAAPAGAQTNQSEVYRVTVVAKSTKAIRYEQQSLPTRIGFKGTVLMPDAKGKATVTPQRGMTAIDAKFERVPAPSRFGTEYLTYVLWAISPEGQTENLGELILDSSDDGRLRVSTRLPTFALIVTAEPYFSVTQPGDVVVLENVVLPETTGKIIELRAKDELFPRGEYVYDRSAAEMNPETPMVSMKQYEALLALYQAQNALQIAEAAGAATEASDTYARASALYEQARQLNTRKGQQRQVVTAAREAVQAAQDARLIAEKRQEQSREEPIIITPDQ